MYRCLLALALVACQKPAPGKDEIPHTTGPIELDGEWAEYDWSHGALRRQFNGEDGQLARPSSEMRLIHDDTTLYVGLYAADENIQSHADAFDVTIGPVSARVDASGQVTPPEFRAGIDHDGTLDNPKDDDEEWVIELALPLAKTGRGSLPVKASRCDVTKDGVKRCGAWSGVLSLP